VLIFEHYFTRELSAAVCEALGNEYPDKEVLNKITIHRLVTTFRCTGSVFVSSVDGGPLLYCCSVSSSQQMRTQHDSSVLLDVTKSYKCCCS
jgi:hypothetical protein